MSSNEITYITDLLQITCIVPHGRGDEAIRVAREAGVGGALLYHAKGAGVRERLGLLGIAIEAEKDVVTMVVASDQRDEVMHALYTRLDLGKPGVGVIYATPLDKMATYIPEETLNRLSQGERK
jgi:nitrogen regulatory protein P-II 1